MAPARRRKAIRKLLDAALMAHPATAAEMGVYDDDHWRDWVFSAPLIMIVCLALSAFFFTLAYLP